MNELLPDATFLAHRPRLFGIAYRMLGTRADAEDVVQDAWLRWRRSEIRDSANSGTYLTRIVTNLSIDALRRVKGEREHYPGPWLPVPLIEDMASGAPEGEQLTALAETLSLALLTMLETVPAHERAAFVLREAFDMPFDEIAACLDAKPATCRQWSRRARERLARMKHDHDEAPALQRAMLERFVQALTMNDVDLLVGLLAADVELVSDGGGKRAAATRALHGVREVSRFLLGLAARMTGRVDGRFVRVNGRPGGLAYVDGNVDSVYSLALRGERIAGIYIVRNPDKIELPASLRP